MTNNALTPQAAAAYVMTILTRVGATFPVTAAGHLRANLDAVPYPCPGFTNFSRDAIAGLILRLAPEIKAIIRTDHVRH